MPIELNFDNLNIINWQKRRPQIDLLGTTLKISNNILHMVDKESLSIDFVKNSGQAGEESHGQPSAIISPATGKVPADMGQATPTTYEKV